MATGLKIQKMMRDQRRDPDDLVAEANLRKDVSDSILDVIYGKIIERHRKAERKRPPGQ